MGTHPIFESDFDCLTAMVQRLTYQHISKPAKAPKCGDTGTPLRGVKAGQPRQMAQYSKRQKTVTRAYGGSLSSGAVRARIIRAFLIEEQKIVVKVLKAKQQAQAAAK